MLNIALLLASLVIEVFDGVFRGNGEKIRGDGGGGVRGFSVWGKKALVRIGVITISKGLTYGRYAIDLNGISTRNAGNGI